jgi:hypothetical protein
MRTETGFAGTVSLELEFPPDPCAMLSWVEEAHRTTAQIMAWDSTSGREEALVGPGFAVLRLDLARLSVALG